jgi:hypothetical protein
VTVGISGTGGGFKKFCSGETDIQNASRPILKEEMALIRLRKSDWPSDVLREKILSLPIKVAVEVMPDRIFG